MKPFNLFPEDRKEEVEKEIKRLEKKISQLVEKLLNIKAYRNLLNAKTNQDETNETV